MSFRFKLYRITTSLALMISGFFVFTGLSVILFQGMSTMFLMSLLFWGACFIHSVLSLYLQRSILLPEVPLKENTPSGIRIMGVIEVLFSSLMIIVGIVLISLPGNIINDVRAMLPAGEQNSITPVTIQVAGGFCLLPGLILIVNAVLSFGILRQWQERQQHDHPEEE